MSGCKDDELAINPAFFKPRIKAILVDMMPLNLYNGETFESKNLETVVFNWFPVSRKAELLNYVNTCRIWKRAYNCDVIFVNHYPFVFRCVEV